MSFLKKLKNTVRFDKPKVIIGIIFVLALFLRLYQLGRFPVGFLWDEAALGYNAYSLLKTGRDEYGEFLPLIFKSFGDYKPGWYIYLTIPSIVLLGLNEFAVRLPSALAGALTIVLFYFFLAKGKKLLEEPMGLVPFLAAFLLAISPWHWRFSRGAWELNLMLLEIMVGFFFLVSSLKSKKSWQLFLSAMFLLLALLTYQAAKFLVPILLIGFAYFFREELSFFKRKLRFGFGGLILGGFLLFNLLTIAGGKAGRIKAMSLFSYPRSPEETAMIFGQDKGNRFLWTIFHSSPVFFTRSVLGRYFNHFSGRYLFFTGDWSNPRNGVIYQGVLYYADLIFLLLGLGVLWAKKRTALENFMLFWLLAAPLPAALTRDSVSAVRSFTMVIPLVFIVSVGIEKVLISVKRRRLKLVLGFLMAALYLVCLIRFLDLYFIHDPKFNSQDYLYGYREAIEYLSSRWDQKEKIIVTDKLGQPHIFFLFYTQYNPWEYQKIARLKENPYGDVGAVEKIGKIEFRKIYWPDDRAAQNALFIGSEFELPLKDVLGYEEFVHVKDVKYLDGKTAFRIVETK